MARLPDVGEELDGYRITGKLHSGGMGSLLTVEAPEDPGFPLVMKIPRLGYGEPAEAVVSYEVEQNVMSVLQGPHVPRYVGAGDLAVQPYIVMELVEGECLKERTEKLPLPADEVARLGAAVATALRSLHQQEVVHLDVKPSNVILRPSGEAVLIDFGLANHAHYPDLLAEENRNPMGSAPYISPEQVLGVRERSAQRPLRPRRHALRVRHREAALRLPHRPLRAAPPAPRRPDPAARHPQGDPRVAPGGHPPPARARREPALRHGGPGGLRPHPPRPGDGDRAGPADAAGRAGHPVPALDQGEGDGAGGGGPPLGPARQRPHRARRGGHQPHQRGPLPGPAGRGAQAARLRPGRAGSPASRW